ncbi:MAG: uncharacterized protein KVP18_002353 [Porospora cf. gigantea A]|uniref:uncharacterized protein n=1 Tax=Porospora cf. gigantea A TaxID=2853593 RepID=UPI003559BC42|nr:MAG: hypothetical protein KVP18_002353 [Porospora cf. gigantea A]
MEYPLLSTRRKVEVPDDLGEDCAQQGGGCKADDLGATGSTVAALDAGDFDSTPSSEGGEFPPAPSYAETLIIFDWDDTVLPSSHLTHLGLDLFDPSSPMEIKASHPVVAENLAMIDLVAAELFSTACGLGHVTIVTNAERGWVELSASRYLPRTFVTMKRLNVSVISARSRFAMQDTAASTWKLSAFKELLDIQPVSPINVLSFGDSECERFALMNSVAGPAYSKSFKFLEGPNTATLLVELRWISELIVRLTSQTGSLDLMFNYNQA